MKIGRKAWRAVAAVLVAVVLSTLSYVLIVRFHFRPAQLVELSLYAFCATAAAFTVIWYSLTLRKRREANWPHPRFIHRPVQRSRGGEIGIRAKRHRAGLRRARQTVVMARCH